jgi:hypothetical protein
LLKAAANVVVIFAFEKMGKACDNLSVGAMNGNNLLTENYLPKV